MSATSRSGDSDAPGVWDVVPSATVTAALCAAACTLWRSDLPDEVAQVRARSLAVLVRRVDAGRADAATNALLDVYGHAATQDPQQLAEQDIVAASAATALSAALTLGETEEPPGVPPAIVAFAALDALARASGVNSDEVLHAHAVALGLAEPVQRIFDGLGLETRRTEVTVATIVAGMAVCLLRHGSDEQTLAWTVGLLASCSMGTGPVPAGGESRALVLGKAAANALLVELLVERGFTANPRALESARGLLYALTGAFPAEDATHELRAPSFGVGVPSVFGSGDAESIGRLAAQIVEGVAWTTLVNRPTTEVVT